MSQVTQEIRSSASDIHHGNDLRKDRSQFLLKEVGLPNGLLPLKEMEECGYVKDTGFVWLKQKKNIEHKFEKIGRLVSYGKEVTAFVEKGKIKKLTGVKTKELFVWVTVSDIYVDSPAGKITFKTSTGMSRTFPASAFEVEEAKDVKNVKGEHVGNGAKGVEATEV